MKIIAFVVYLLAAGGVAALLIPILQRSGDKEVAIVAGIFGAFFGALPAGAGGHAPAGLFHQPGLR